MSDEKTVVDELRELAIDAEHPMWVGIYNKLADRIESALAEKDAEIARLKAELYRDIGEEDMRQTGASQ